MRLDDIDYFLAVVQHGQVRRAALALDVSQPAITKGIQRLERELGFPLFVRSIRGMRLTTVAERFHQRTQSLRADLGDAIKEAADLHLGAMGVLRVGVSPLYTQRVFVPASLQLHRQRPAARLLVNINLNDVLMPLLRSGDIDLSINALPATMPEDLLAVPLITDDLYVVARDGHPLLARRRLKLADLTRAQWLLPSPQVEARRKLEALFTGAGLPRPQVAVEVSNTVAQLTGLLAHSDLLAITSELQLASPAGQHLQALPLAELRFPRQIGVLTRRNVPLSPLAERFVDVLRETVGSSRAAG
ncbi:LysR family transcriptional regulator [Piscinibacter gummiphilus]|uniref:LysR family transcriptional regulator n=1 Tax=Piscinibacter gummiphilus TaxID=946333 RepID=A0ABZ0CLS0_9BURK|nr:LysR family transcriptional regulator [Piscinibacter gummiphilus]WOB05917.1 LysR family transcriptional regulator [Piscinibacter gummiphilus]